MDIYPYICANTLAMKIIFGSILFLFFSSAMVSAQEKSDTTATGWTDCTPVQFQELLSDTLVVLLDVRTIAEYEAGHIEGARNLDVRNTEFDRRIQFLRPGRPLAVYCKSGVRSRIAAKKLVQKGFKVYNLDRGYLTWPYKIEK